MAYWTDGTRARLLVGTGDAYLLAIDVKTGGLDREFGEGGRVDLMAGVERAVRTTLYSNSSAPVVTRDRPRLAAIISNPPETACLIVNRDPPTCRRLSMITGR